MAIESEEKRERITDTVERWAEHTLIRPYLREYDIPSLVNSIITEFYHVCLCCGHWVERMDEGVELSMVDTDGSTISGVYCRDCAEVRLREGWNRGCACSPVGCVDL